MPEYKELTNEAGKKDWVIRFPEWASYVARAISGPFSRPDSRSSQSIRVSGDTWQGTRTFDEAIELAKLGWPQKAREIAAQARPLFPLLSSEIEREEVILDVEGTGLDVARFVEGEPECFTRLSKRNAIGTYGKKLLRILVNVGVNATVESDRITARGSAVVLLAQCLEIAGHRTEIVIGERAENNKYATEMYATVKRMDQPMDLPRLAFALAHTACFRRLGFSVMESAPHEALESVGIYSGGGYGHASTVSDKNKCDIYIPGFSESSINWISPEIVADWIREQLQAKGVGLKLHMLKTA